VSRQHPTIITVATSNFTDALDDAFESRADVAIEVPLPDVAGAEAILKRTLIDFGSAYPKIGNLAADPALATVARRLAGLDGRRIRKLVTEALGRRLETVTDPNALTMRDLAEAAAEADTARRAARDTTRIEDRDAAA
jgi:SpoVK/Ycf46/Vps4 family AAA+-type ATPase